MIGCILTDRRGIASRLGRFGPSRADVSLDPNGLAPSWKIPEAGGVVCHQRITRIRPSPQNYTSSCGKN